MDSGTLIAAQELTQTERSDGNYDSQQEREQESKRSVYLPDQATGQPSYPLNELVIHRESRNRAD